MNNHPVNKEAVEKILVLKPRAIGDVVLSTAVLPNLKGEFPHARIDFLTESFVYPVLEGNPYIDNILTYTPGRDSSLAVILRVRKNRYDLVIDLFANPRTAVITLLSGARYRVGYPFKWRRLAYNILVQPRGDRVHNVEFNLDALRRIGVTIESASPFFSLDRKSETFAADFVLSKGLNPGEFMTFNVGGGWATKRWPAEKFAELSRMIGDHIHRPVVVLYGPGEIHDARKICGLSDAILAPQTSLKEMAAITKASYLLVTNDSGPMHIAAALGVPTLAIFGPTDPRLQGPYGNISEVVRNDKLDCLECNLTKCPIGNICMNELDAAIVFDHLRTLIAKISGQTPPTTPLVSKGAANANENV
jgi:lipopolysaccharide heptosyltransferase II